MRHCLIQLFSVGQYRLCEVTICDFTQPIHWPLTIYLAYVYQFGYFAVATVGSFDSAVCLLLILYTLQKFIVFIYSFI